MLFADASHSVTEVSSDKAPRPNQNITEKVISVEESSKAKSDLNDKNELLSKADNKVMVAFIKTPERETEKKIEEHVSQVKTEETEKKVRIDIKRKIH